MTRERNPNDAVGPQAGPPSEGNEGRGTDRVEPAPPQKRRWRLSRRGFLIGLGAAGASLAVGVYFGKPALHLFMAESLASIEHAGNSFMQLPADPALWLEVLCRIAASVLRWSRSKWGRAIHTSIAQIAMEELGIGWDDLVVEQADTSSDLADGFGTGGSFSVATSYDPLRRAAAGMRSLLQQEAAAALGQPERALRVDGRGFAVADDREQRVDFHRLAAAITDWDLPGDEQLQLKPVDAFTVIGQPVARIDIPDKVTGRAVYGYDMRLPDMLFGAVARPPTLGGQTAQRITGRSRRDGGGRIFLD